MKREYIPLHGPPSQGIEALESRRDGATYSDAVRVDLADASLLFISGKTGSNDGYLRSRTMWDQTTQAFENIKASLERQGATMADIVRLRIYVTQIDRASIRDVHEVRAGYFAVGAYPASTLVRVDQLVRDGAIVEIEADAVIGKDRDSS
jgi:enamine deaminase RidA (YjgF/YER057c/UK114 family)